MPLRLYRNNLYFLKITQWGTAIFWAIKKLNYWWSQVTANLSLCTPWRHIRNVGIAPFIQVYTSWRCAVNFTPRPFDPCKNNIWYHLDGKYGRSQCQSGHLGDEKNTCSCREVNPGLSSPLHRHCNYWAVPVACYMIKWRRMSGIPKT